MQPIIDTHCHLDFTAFDTDRNDVLNACEKNHISDIVIPAVSANTWQKTIDLCQQNQRQQSLENNKPNNNATPASQTKADIKLHLALGLHPLFIDQHEPQHLTLLDELTHRCTPKAIGEIGLDYYLKNPDREKQRLFFTKQLIIAKRHRLPVIIHVRKAHDDCVKLLQEINVGSGIIHNFNGSIQHAHHYIEQGFKLGFGGTLTFKRSRVIQNLAKQIPLEAIVLETDAPDLTVEVYQGQRNSPEYLTFVLQSLAKIKQRSETDVAIITSNNAKSVLKL